MESAQNFDWFVRAYHFSTKNVLGPFSTLLSFTKWDHWSRISVKSKAELTGFNSISVWPLYAFERNKWCKGKFGSTHATFPETSPNY